MAYESKEELKQHYSAEGWLTASIPLNEPLIKIISEHLRNMRDLFDLSPEDQEIAWLIDEKRLEIEHKIREPKDVERRSSKRRPRMRKRGR